jgi:hypothetical protein
MKSRRRLLARKTKARSLTPPRCGSHPRSRPLETVDLSYCECGGRSFRAGLAPLAKPPATQHTTQRGEAAVPELSTYEYLAQTAAHADLASAFNLVSNWPTHDIGRIIISSWLQLLTVRLSADSIAMTLIQTLLTPTGVLQVSDRQLTYPDGRVLPAPANKAVIWCGHMTVGFSGMAFTDSSTQRPFPSGSHFPCGARSP